MPSTRNPSPKPPMEYQLRVTLLGISPPIWRRLRVADSIPMCCLHDALQAVMGWTDSHLHQFERDGQYWGIPEHYPEDDIPVAEEWNVPLRRVLSQPGDSLMYTYDFGDDWRHEVVLEAITVSGPGHTKPLCLAGGRRCPPEDVGGVSGYERFLEVIFDPQHEEFEDYLAWAGGPFHAEEFDLRAVNDGLSRMRWPIRHSGPRRL